MKRFLRRFPLPLIIGAVAVLTCVIVLICIFSGDKKENEEPVIPTRGSVILNVGAVVQIDYSDTGKVTNLTAINGSGALLMEQITDYVNTPATDLVTRLLTAAKEEGYFNGLKTVILRQTKGSQLPQSTGFLPDLQAHIQKEVGVDYNVVLLTVDDLDSHGMIDYRPALKLLQLHIDGQITEASSTGDMRNDLLGFYVTVDGVDKFYLVDVITGSVSEGNADEFYAGMEESYPTDPEETMPEDFFDNMDGYYEEPPFIEEEPFPTEIEDTIPTEVEDTLPQEETTTPTE